MSDKPLPEIPKQPNWPLWVIIACCALLVFWLKFEGILLAIIIVALTVAVLKFRPNSREIETVRASLALSIEDIQHVLAEYDYFLSSGDAEAVADRTMLRPALADETSTVPEIERFHELRAAAERYCARVAVRMETKVPVSHLESLLSATDRRASELQEAWVQARHAARKLAP